MASGRLASQKCYAIRTVWLQCDVEPSRVTTLVLAYLYHHYLLPQPRIDAGDVKTKSYINGTS